MTWHSFEGDDATWDVLVGRFAVTTPFQLSAWARFRAYFGWRLLRLVADDHSCATQLLVRSFGPMRVVWGAGAPLGKPSAAHLDSLPRAVRDALGAFLVYLRVADHRTFDDMLAAEFLSAGWKRPTRTLSTCHTLTRTLQPEESGNDAKYSSNWSRNLRRGIQRHVNARQWSSPDPSEVARLHRDVENLKQSFDADWRGDADAISRLFQCFGDRLVIVRSIAADDSLLAIRAAVLLGDAAFDFLAATSTEGRRCYASNVALDELLALLAARGVSHYDFGGVDHVNNKGVFDFKHGAGGRDHRYIGEFEIASPKMAKRVLSRLVALRISA